MLDKNIAIQFDGVGKQYRLGLVGTGSLQHDLNRWWQTTVMRREDPYLKIGEVNDRSVKGHSDYVWALKDISFKVEQGDVVGIIGKNGAGKSTLLKLLSHITAPTVGDIRYRGRIASLLEVGTGFHPEMTARQNIYMNGSIMGMTKHEIDRKLDEIVDFAGIERYLDTPVKRFSSGMTVRLGFAVAAFLEPEILVVDEVLAVGDAEFQKKAIGKMQDVSSHGGRTVLFVSHNMASVRNLCKNGIVLKNGLLSFQGSVDDAIEHYMMSNLEAYSSLDVADMPRRKGNKSQIKFTGVEFLNEKDQPITPHCGRFLRIRLEVQVETGGFDGCSFAMGMYDNYGTIMLSYNTLFSMERFHMNEGKQYISCDIEKLPLTGGNYRLSIWAGINGIETDCVENTIKMTVEDDDFFGYGKIISRELAGKVVLCNHKWNV